MNNLATILITITLLTGGTETVYFDVPVHEAVQQKELNVEYQIAEKDILVYNIVINKKEMIRDTQSIQVSDISE